MMKNIDYHVFALKKIILFSENTALVSHIDGCLAPNTWKIKANTGGVIFHLPCVRFVLETPIFANILRQHIIFGFMNIAELNFTFVLCMSKFTFKSNWRQDKQANVFAIFWKILTKCMVRFFVPLDCQ